MKTVIILITILLNYVQAQREPTLVTTLNGHLRQLIEELPNGDFVTISVDSKIRIWNASDGVLKTTIDPNHGGELNAFSVTVLPNGDLVSFCVTWYCTPYESIKIWDSRSGELKRSFGTINETIRISNCIGLPNGDLLTVLTDKYIHIYNPNDGTLKRVLSGHLKSGLSFAVMPDKGYLISADFDGTIIVWDINNEYTMMRTMISPDRIRIQSLLMLSNDDLASLYLKESSIVIWDPNDGTLKRTIFTKPLIDNCLATLLNGDLVSLDNQKSVIRVLNPNDGTFKYEFKVGESSQCPLKMLPNGYLAVGSNDLTIRIWDFHVKRSMNLTLSGHSDAILAVVKLLNGDLASSSRDSTIRIWDTSNGSLKRTLIGHTDWIHVLVVLPSGDLVSGSDDTTIKIWSTVDGTLKRTLKGHNDWVRALAVLSSGDLVSGSDDKTIRIWNTETGELKRTISEHGDRVRQLTVLSENSFASASDDKTVRIWFL